MVFALSATGTRTDLDGWFAALDQLIPVPERFREQLIDRANACVVLGTDEEVLDHLLDRGLPCVQTDEGERYVFHDVVNVALYSGSRRSMPETAQRLMMRYSASNPETWVRPQRWQVRWELAAGENDRISLRLPDPEAFGGGSSRLTVDGAPGVPGCEAELAGPKVRVEADVELVGAVHHLRQPALRELYREVLAELGGGAYRYQWMPHGLQTDMESFLRNGTLDCVAISLLLVERAAARGIAAWARRGAMLGMVGVEHAWAECLDSDGVFKPLDPVLAFLGAREGCHPDFLEFCAGSVPNRFLPWRVNARDRLAGADPRRFTSVISATTARSAR